MIDFGFWMVAKMIDFVFWIVAKMIDFELMAVADDDGVFLDRW